MAHVAGPALTQEGADEKQTMREDREICRRGGRKERPGVTTRTTVETRMRMTAKMRDEG